MRRGHDQSLTAAAHAAAANPLHRRPPPFGTHHRANALGAGGGSGTGALKSWDSGAHLPDGGGYIPRTLDSLSDGGGYVLGAPPGRPEYGDVMLAGAAWRPSVTALSQPQLSRHAVLGTQKVPEHHRRVL